MSCPVFWPYVLRFLCLKAGGRSSSSLGFVAMRYALCAMLFAFFACAPCSLRLTPNGGLR